MTKPIEFEMDKEQTQLETLTAELAKIMGTALGSYNNKIFSLTKYGTEQSMLVFPVGDRRFIIKSFHSGKDSNYYSTIVVEESLSYLVANKEVFRFFPTGKQDEIEFVMPFYSRLIRGTHIGCVIRMLSIAGIEQC